MARVNTFILFVLFQWVVYVSAHSWLDCIKVENPTEVNSLAGMKCKGYPGNYVGRERADDNMRKIEGTMTQTAFLNTLACRTPDRIYTPEYPMLSLRAGEYMTLGYTPNGHTEWMAPPPPHGPRNFYIKWVPTGAGTQMRTVADVLNAETLYTIQFDTPCHDRTTKARLDPSSGLCTADIQIPPGTKQGVYQFVWYWPFRFGGDDLIEDYISCFDIEVLPAGATSTTGPVFPDPSMTGTGAGTTGNTVPTTNPNGPTQGPTKGPVGPTSDPKATTLTPYNPSYLNSAAQTTMQVFVVMSVVICTLLFI